MKLIVVVDARVGVKTRHHERHAPRLVKRGLMLAHARDESIEHLSRDGEPRKNHERDFELFVARKRRHRARHLAARRRRHPA